MAIHVFRFRTENAELAEKAYAIRNMVFVREQSVPIEIEYDGLDSEASHYLLQYKGIAAATARWRETPKGIKLERFAVLKEFRKHGLGGIILEEVLVDVIPLGKRIYLHSQESAVKFYESHGFIRKGPPFIEADIVHYVMERPVGC